MIFRIFQKTLSRVDLPNSKNVSMNDKELRDLKDKDNIKNRPN
ncbi:hypothetical protein CZ794_03765 [Psychrobacter sp. JB385]|nr:hypothetical protein CZ794_03765 [Psychrobacter sp. JB385]